MQTVNAKSVTKYPDAPDIESSTEDYAGRFSGAIGSWLVDRQINGTRKALVQYFGHRSEFTVLDVGGGHGQNIEVIKELGGNLTVLGSTADCDVLIKDYIKAGKVDFVVSPLLSLPYEDNSFDVVICYRILSHMASWKALIAELSRVSCHLVLIDYPSKKSVNVVAKTLFAIKKKIEKNTRPYGCYTDSEIDLVFAHANQRRVFEFRQFFLPMALYRLIGNVGIATLLAKMFRFLGLTDRFGSPVICGFSPMPASR
ncbi:MAG: class I SAM-dependent methyltransferase [Acidiferrobacterales bacterium]|nr:class I SAM-dependent methyltransferase [Acidiferrobacterales bacterium]